MYSCKASAGICYGLKTSLKLLSFSHSLSLSFQLLVHILASLVLAIFVFVLTFCLSHNLCLICIFKMDKVYAWPAYAVLNPAHHLPVYVFLSLSLSLCSLLALCVCAVNAMCPVSQWLLPNGLLVWQSGRLAVWHA